VAKCTTCGTDVAAQYRFCLICGAEMPAAPAGNGPRGVAVEIVPLDSTTSGDAGARDSGASRWILRGVFTLVIVGLGTYYLLPGLFDPSSKTLFASGDRRSPLLALMGPIELLNQPYEVAAGDVARLDFTVDAPAPVTVELTWSEGPPIEVFVTQASEYDHFRETFARGEGDVRHYAELASTPGPEKTSISGTVNLGPGTYTIVFEHTANGAVKPPRGEGKAKAEGRVRVEAE
jgi:hypothetical protein